MGLPVVVARAYLLVAVNTRRNTEAFGTALLAEEHAWLLVRCRRAPIRTFWLAIRRTKLGVSLQSPKQNTNHFRSDPYMLERSGPIIRSWS